MTFPIHRGVAWPNYVSTRHGLTCVVVTVYDGVVRVAPAFTRRGALRRLTRMIEGDA